MNKVLLFDFDGTIADSLENFLEIVNTLSIKYKFPALSKEDVDKLRAENPRTLIKQLKISFYKIPFMARDMRNMQKQQIQNIKPFKGLPEVLYKLKSKGYTLGIVTSNGKENVKQFVKNNNIDLFEYVYGDISLFGKEKALRKFLKENYIAKENVLYIGDEIRDIQACQKVGIKIAAVTWGFNSKGGLAKYNPNFLINKPVELLEVLKV